MRKSRAGYQRQWKQQHPQEHMQHQLTYAARLLTRHGFTVVPPIEGTTEVEGR